MPLPNTYVGSHQRAAMLGSITRVFGNAKADMAGIESGVLRRAAQRPFDLLEVTRAQADWAIERAQRNLVQLDEGNCFNRALYGAHSLAQRLEAGRSPLDDAFHSALAVLAYRHTAGGYSGGFHTKLALRLVDEPEIQLIDPLEGNPRLQPLSTWRANATVPRLIRPFAGSGVPLADGSLRASWLEPEYMDTARRYLHQTIRAAVPKGGGHVADLRDVDIAQRVPLRSVPDPRQA